MNIKNVLKKIGVPVLTIGAIMSLTGCAGTSFTKVGTTMSGEKIAITKKDVHAKTKMSETVFLEPVAPEDQIIFFRFRNTSDETLNVTQKLKAEFEKRGFIVTRNPKEANFMVQANLLKVGEMDLNEQKKLFRCRIWCRCSCSRYYIINRVGGYNRSGKAALVGALVGLAIEAAKVKDVHFAMVTDVEIRQRPLDGEKVIQADGMAGQMGKAGVSMQLATNENVKWKKYRTRIVSSAYAPGLDFSQAQPFLEDGLVKALSGTM